MAGTLLSILLLLAVLPTTRSQCIPPGGSCTGCHDVITCDMTVQPWTITLSNFPFSIANDFTLTNINSVRTVLGSDFSSFSAYNSTALTDYNIIKFECGTSGGLTLNSASFTGLDHYKNVRITNCALTLGHESFAQFRNLTSLAMYGGNIISVTSNTFRGLEMVQTGQVGTASINITSSLPNGTFPVDFFGPVANSLQELRVTDNNWANYHHMLLYNLTQLRLLDMSRTANDWVPDNFFDNTPMMSFIYLYGLNWACICPQNTWLFNWEVNSGVRIHSDFICESPAAEKGKYMRKWKIESCDKQGIGFFVGTYWVGLYQIILWVLTIVFLALSIVALCLAKKALKQKPVGGLAAPKDTGGKKPLKSNATRPAPQPRGPPQEGQPPPVYDSIDDASTEVKPEPSGSGAAPATTVVTQAVVNSHPAVQSPNSDSRPQSARHGEGTTRASLPPVSTEDPGEGKTSGLDRFRKMAAKVRLQKKVVNTWGDD